MKKKLSIILSIAILIVLTACGNNDIAIDEFILLERSNEKLSSADSYHARFSQDFFVSTFGFGSVVDIDGEVFIEAPLSDTPRFKSLINAHFLDVSLQTTTYFHEGNMYVIDHQSDEITVTSIDKNEVLKGFESNLINTLLQEEQIITSSYSMTENNGFILEFELNHLAIVDVLETQGELIEIENIRSGSFTLLIYLDESYQQTDVHLHIELSHNRQQIEIETIVLVKHVEFLQINNVRFNHPLE